MRYIRMSEMRESWSTKPATQSTTRSKLRGLCCLGGFSVPWDSANSGLLGGMVACNFELLILGFIACWHLSNGSSDDARIPPGKTPELLPADHCTNHTNRTWQGTASAISTELASVSSTPPLSQFQLPKEAILLTIPKWEIF